MGTYKEETLRAKAVKEGIIDQRPLLPKSRKKRPVVLEYRWRAAAHCEPPGEWGLWKTWGRYATETAAKQAADKHSREQWKQGRYEYRVKETT